MCSNLVILDCDGGSDDAWALLLLLRAEKANHLKLLAITTSGCGNTTREHAARNMQRILKASNRENLPIYLGAVEPLISINEDDKKYFHGRDGFGDCLVDADDYADVNKFVQPLHATTAIYELCKKHSKKITVFAVGPLTNLALGYAMHGAEFGHHIKELYIMGGNYQGIGNSSRSAEFNFHCDPEAAHAVLSKTKCPITILPWEACLNVNFNIPLQWRLTNFAMRAVDIQHAAIIIVNRVEAEQYKIQESWNPCDALAIAAWLFGKQFVKKQSTWHVTVDLRGTHTRGQMVLDHLGEHEKYPTNVQILECVDAEFFKSIIEWVAGLRELSFSD